jgi:hypothetical protein
MQRVCQSGTGRRFVGGRSADCWRHGEKYPAESSKMMKLKGFWYIAGYCLSSKACTELVKKRKLFLFWLFESGLEGENVEKAFFVPRVIERLRKHRFFER